MTRARYDIGACRHLRDDPDADFYRHFTGESVVSWFLCYDCLKAVNKGEPVVVEPISPEEVKHIGSEGFLEGITGAPSIIEASGSPLCPIEELRIEDGPVLRTMAAMPDGTWLALNGENSLECIAPSDTGTFSRRVVTHIDLPDEPNESWNGRNLTPRIVPDPTGRFAAVVNDYGRYGLVIDLSNDCIAMRLNGGDYHPETVPQSVCFVLHRGKPILLHRTQWNRLDASDPETGTLLTEREFPPSSDDKKFPEHYLDYFHGGLYPSPSGTMILNDGWVWHPFGVTTLFDSSEWLDGNAWETEDKLTRLISREDWDTGFTWIDDKTIALEHLFAPAHTGAGLGLLIDIATKETTPIAGPRGHFFSDGRRLFSADSEGLSVWDVQAGTCIGFIPDFKPTLQHPWTKQLAELDGNLLRTWRYDRYSA